MRVLVAGDRGYIGAVLVPFVKSAGHEVVEDHRRPPSYPNKPAMCWNQRTSVGGR